MLEGALDKMRVYPGEPARYELVATDPGGEACAEPAGTLSLSELLGRGLRIEYLRRISCSHCGAETPRSYGGGYCYDCFRRLARCDLCVVSPARCHYHQGTCREPAWGEAFCMQPHLVYLANSSGPKVGITGAGGAVTRWLDQGATQGLVVARADTRHLAGVLEAGLARMVSDRTDWRALVMGDAPPIDLPALRDSLRGRLGELPPGVRWLSAEPVEVLSFPVQAYPRQPLRLRLDRHPLVAGRLVGVKGQYLLFEHGVFSVRWHRAYQVRIEVAEPGVDVAVEPANARPDDSQMELFS